MQAGVPTSRYMTVAQLLTDTEMVARGTYRDVADGSGPFKVPRQPFQFSGAPLGGRPHVADLGEDTEAVLRELLDLSQERIAALRAMKVLL